MDSRFGPRKPHLLHVPSALAPIQRGGMVQQPAATKDSKVQTLSYPTYPTPGSDGRSGSIVIDKGFWQLFPQGDVHYLNRIFRRNAATLPAVGASASMTTFVVPQQQVLVVTGVRPFADAQIGLVPGDVEEIDIKRMGFYIDFNLTFDGRSPLDVALDIGPPPAVAGAAVQTSAFIDNVGVEIVPNSLLFFALYAKENSIVSINVTVRAAFPGVLADVGVRFGGVLVSMTHFETTIKYNR